MPELGHSVDVNDPAHEWYEHGMYLRFSDSVQFNIFYCKGCPAQRSIELTYPKGLVIV